MSIDIEQFKFPSGRPVGSARKDAKKLSKEKNITLIEAQNRIAEMNGAGVNWDQAINQLKSNLAHTPAVSRLDLSHLWGGIHIVTYDEECSAESKKYCDRLIKKLSNSGAVDYHIFNRANVEGLAVAGEWEINTTARRCLHIYTSEAYDAVANSMRRAAGCVVADLIYERRDLDAYFDMAKTGTNIILYLDALDQSRSLALLLSDDKKYYSNFVSCINSLSHICCDEATGDQKLSVVQFNENIRNELLSYHDDTGINVPLNIKNLISKNSIATEQDRQSLKSK